MSRRALLLPTALIVSVIGACMSLSSSPVVADQQSRQMGTLEARAAALEQEISVLQQQGATDLARAASLQQTLAMTQASLDTAKVQFSQANQRLATTTSQLLTAEGTLAADRHQLSALLVGIYRMQGNGSVTAALVDSKSFAAAVDVVTSLHQVSQRVRELVVAVRQKEEQLTELRNQQRVDFDEAQHLVSSLQRLSTQQATQQAAFQAEAGKLSGRAALLVAQLGTVQSQLYQLEAAQVQAQALPVDTGRVMGSALAPFGLGPRVDYFPWGQCTWYVASLRTVTWDGNAWAWAPNAAAAGRPEGMIPKPGAIVVWGPGNGYSAIGHVAYVASVQSPTSFTVNEANYFGLGIVDQRFVPSLRDVEAFVY